MRRVLIALLAAETVAFAAEPGLLDMVMPDAKVVFGVNVGKILASPLGQTMASQLEAADPQVQKFVKSSGFDPLRDLQEIVVASTGESSKAPTLVLARGAFDPARIGAFPGFEGASASTSFQGVPILKSSKKGAGVLAFLDKSVVAIGPLEIVQQAIARRGQGVRLEPKLAAKVSALRAKYDIWGVSTAPIGPLAGDMPQGNARSAMQGDVFKSIESFSGGVSVGTSLEVSAEVVTHTAKDASALADALRLLAGMLQLDQKNQKAVAENFQMQVRANTLQISLKLPESQLRSTMQAGRKAAATPPADSVETPPDRVPPGAELVIQSSPKDMGTVVVPRTKP